MLITIIAGLSTALGGLFPLFFKNFNRKILFFSLGMSAGVMVYISFVEMIPEAIQEVGFTLTNIAFFVGIIFMMVLDFLIPHKYIAENNVSAEDQKNNKFDRAGKFTALGIAIHNFPEGMIVFMSAMIDINLGIVLAIAVAIHNIPEGIAIAAPIYYATKSKIKAFMYCFLAGIAEPAGALVLALFFINYFNPFILGLSLAFVAGVMIFISFDELLPISFKENHDHIATAGIFIGMLIMAITLLFL
ncbi:MAG: zinc transporter ZupT [Candidatus Woesearchaeota archaeon]